MRAAEACILFNDCAALIGICTAPLFCFNVNLLHLYIDEYQFGRVSNKRATPPDFYLLLDLGDTTGDGFAAKASDDNLHFMVLEVVTALKHCRSRFRFIVDDGLAPEPRTSEQADEDDEGPVFPTEEMVRNKVDDLLLSSTRFVTEGPPPEAVQLIEYLTLDELRLRVGDRMFKLMTDKDYAG